jgi:hypothetical protein
MTYNILYVQATHKARIAWVIPGNRWGEAETGSDVVNVSRETLKEFVLSIVDCGWDVTITTI